MDISKPKPKPVDFLLAKDVANKLGVHPNTFRLYLRKGRLPDFPKPRKLGLTDSQRWLSDEVEEWMHRQHAIDEEALRLQATPGQRRSSATGSPRWRGARRQASHRRQKS